MSSSVADHGGPSIFPMPIWKVRCSACGTHSEMGKHYWHLMRCEPWLLIHHPLRDEEGEVVEPRTIDHPLGLALSGAVGAPLACHVSAVEGFLPEPTSPPGVGRPTERKAGGEL